MSEKSPITKLHATNIPIQLLDSLNNYNITFLVAPPAYGKSVLLTDVLSNHHRKSIILIPNKTSISLLYKYTSKLFPNRKIGYKMHNDSSSTYLDDLTLITTGYFLEWISYNKKILNAPLTLVIDEAHVSDWQTDLVIRIALYYRTFNKKLKVILSSATLDIERFSYMAHDYERSDIDIISLPIEKPNVNITYIDGDSSKILQLIETHLIGVNTLIICPGEQDINNVIDLFKSCKDPLFENAMIKSLYSKLDLEDISEALNIKDEWTILIATNIVESSVTIKGIDAVIDFGLRKLAYIDNKGKLTLKTTKAAKSNIIQGLSRCGRSIKEGLGFVLMSESKYNLLEEYPESEVYRNPLYNQIFRLIRAELSIYDVFCEEELNLYVKQDMHMLKSHGIIKISEIGYELTEIGSIVSKIGLSLLSNKFLVDVIFHEEEDIWYYAILIATYSDLTDPVFYKPVIKYKENQLEFQKRYRVIKDLYEKYKIGKDSLDEILLIANDLFIIDKNNMILNNTKLSNSGLNSKTIKTWVKSINYTIISLRKLGYFIKIPSTSIIERSDSLRARFSPYLYSAFNESFYDTYTLNIKNTLKIDNNCHYIFTNKCESDELNFGDKKSEKYIFALSTFSAGGNDIISKVIKYHHPIMSNKSRSLLQNNLNISIDIWENLIFIYLTLEEKLKVLAASRY